MPLHDDERRVAGGYDAVYAALPDSPTFARIWREHAIGADFPVEFDHISFLTLPEVQRMTRELRLVPRAMLLDLACGMGGPGLWIARESGAHLIGIDISNVALTHATDRAALLGLATSTRYVQASFAETGLDAASVDAAMSCDALQYAPDKQAACDEAARVLRPGGRLVFVCFEFEVEHVRGLPVLGTDPTSDYAPLLERAGFTLDAYAETPGWSECVAAAYGATIEAKEALTVEMGEAACATLLGEMTLTLQMKPYRRRVFAVATKRESGASPPGR